MIGLVWQREEPANQSPSRNDVRTSLVGWMTQQMKWINSGIRWRLSGVERYYSNGSRQRAREEREFTIITLHACTRGKVIGSVVVVVVDIKIAKFGDLGTWASCKHRQKTGFSMLRIEWYGLQASQIVYFLLAIVATPIDHAHLHYAYMYE